MDGIEPGGVGGKGGGTHRRKEHMEGCREGSVDPLPIVNEFQLFEELRQVIERAERGGVARGLIHPLFEASDRIMNEISRMRRENRRAALPERRNDFRIEPNKNAMAVSGEVRFPVEILDLGAHGFGIRSSTPVPSGSFLILELPGEEGPDAFSCFVAFCREREDGYRMGLRIFAKLPRS